ncbi:RNA methyltransferase [Pyrus ussuriensis x Pyrus communis]|uniref:RNA methyltransferase n=1 Tax=Pyrus ussuriensis x Pyrus communis TaxID=2448454 RepID=A0A5N5HT91_9ROSA|nr:RNA methyltransferase [Pyrus ussuriensis x Pyrus communis]
MHGASRLSLFCVGGPYGLGKQLRERADDTLIIGSLSFTDEQPHQVERERIEEFYYDNSVVSLGKPLGKMEIEAMIQAAIEPRHISSAQHAGFLLDV